MVMKCGNEKMVMKTWWKIKSKYKRVGSCISCNIAYCFELNRYIHVHTYSIGGLPICKNKTPGIIRQHKENFYNKRIAR